MLLPTENQRTGRRADRPTDQPTDDSPVALAVRQAVTDGLLGEDRPLAGFVDVRGVRDSVAGLHEAFARVPDVLHTFAAKACSLVPVLRLLADSRHGLRGGEPRRAATGAGRGVRSGAHRAGLAA